MPDPIGHLFSRHARREAPPPRITRRGGYRTDGMAGSMGGPATRPPIASFQQPLPPSSHKATIHLPPSAPSPYQTGREGALYAHFRDRLRFPLLSESKRLPLRVFLTVPPSILCHSVSQHLPADSQQPYHNQILTKTLLEGPPKKQATFQTLFCKQLGFNFFPNVYWKVAPNRT